jgi:hypothetical protein
MDSDSTTRLHRLPHSAIRINERLPDSWEIRELDSLVEHDSPICYGILMPGDDQPDGVFVVRVKDMIDGRVARTGLLRTSKDIDGKYARSRLKANDILLAIRGATAGLVATISADLEGANITQDTARIRIRGDCCADYIYHLLQGEFVQHQIKLNIVGQAVQGINIAEVRRLAIPLPPIPEQKRIATILSTWDQAIELAENLIVAESQVKTALIQQLLTGKVRIPRFAKSAATMPTHYGDLPTDWRYLRIGEIATESAERNKDGTTRQVLSCTKYDGLVDSLSYFGRQIFSDDLSTYKLVQRDQFAYATNHIEEGSIGYQNLCDIALRACPIRVER